MEKREEKKSWIITPMPVFNMQTQVSEHEETCPDSTAGTPELRLVQPASRPLTSPPTVFGALSPKNNRKNTVSTMA